MFLSKLFSIFKRKKDNQNASNGGSPAGQIVTPSAAVGATVGLGQPSQPSQTSPSTEPQQAEAPSAAPEIAQADVPAPSAPSFDVPSDDNKPAEPDNTLPAQPVDDAQDTTIGGDDTGPGTDSPPLNPDPVPPQPSDDPDMGVVTPPPSDDNDQFPAV
jgi:hypothetical protein